MFSECPNCVSLFKVSAENLRTAMGMVRCTHCATVFNALATLRDEHEVEMADAETIGSQLPVRELGDAIVINPSFLAQQEWYRDAIESTRPPRMAADDEGPAAVAAERRPRYVEPSHSPAAAPRENFTPTSSDETSPHKRRSATQIVAAVFGQTINLALRNLTRHRRRTGMALGAIGFGVIALVLAGGFAEWMMWKERESTIHSRLGHIQLVRSGFFEKGVADPHAYLIGENTVLTERLATLPHVKTVTPRLNFSGLISKGETTVSFLGEGVAPETEAEVSEDMIVHAGEPLAASSANGIILGKGLAASLGAQPGDSVVLLANDADGKISARDAIVSGIFHTAVKAFDDVSLRAPISLARALMRAKGSHQIIILLDQTEDTQLVTRGLRHMIPEQKTGLQIVPWIDLADFYKAVVALFSAQTAFVRTIIAIIIIMSISNTLVMSVMERTSEIGTLMAIGFRSHGIMRLFVTEGLILGLFGGVAGTFIGYCLALLISHVGIPMPPAPGMDEGFVASIRVTWQIAFSGFLVAVVSAVIASLYPAWKASHLEIVDALRRAR